MKGKHAATSRRRGSTALRVAAVITMAAWQAARPVLAAGWALARPYLLRAWIRARNCVLRHCNARDVTLILMVFAYPLTAWAEQVNLLPNGRGFAAGTEMMTTCGIILWLLQSRAQRKWREKRGEVLQGAAREDRAGLAEVRAELAAVRQALAAGYAYAGKSVPSGIREPDHPPHLHVVRGPDDTGPQDAVA